MALSCLERRKASNKGFNNKSSSAYPAVSEKSVKREAEYLIIIHYLTNELLSNGIEYTELNIYVTITTTKNSKNKSNL